MQLFLEPVDVWLFRDGKPFDAFSDHRARSLFPPFPSVMQGAIRSYHLVVKKVDLRNPLEIIATVGTAENLRELRLQGPFIAKKEDNTINRYLPVPADVVPDKKMNVYRSLLLRSCRDKGILTSAPAQLSMHLWTPEGAEPAKESLGEWMIEQELFKCLDGEPATAVHSDDLFARESRFGIGLKEDTQTTEEGAWYEGECIRPHPGVGLWVQVTGYNDWPATGTLRIGGEARGAHFTQIEPLEWPTNPSPLPSRFKVYFASPAYFEDGWKPKGGWGQFFEGAVKLQAVALNHYEIIGGFDLAAGRQKPARRYVPAGSVYYFSSDGTAQLKRDMITEYGAEIGFGQIIITERKE